MNVSLKNKGGCFELVVRKSNKGSFAIIGSFTDIRKFKTNKDFNIGAIRLLLSSKI